MILHTRILRETLFIKVSWFYKSVYALSVVDLERVSIFECWDQKSLKIFEGTFQVFWASTYRFISTAHPLN